MVIRVRGKAFSTFMSVVSGLLLTEASLTAESQASVDVSLSAKPAVVRIVTACEGYVAVNGEKGEEGDRRPYAVGEVGTGFFVNASGYIVTNQHVIELSGKDKEAACEKQLIRNIIKDVTGEDISNEDVEGGTQLDGVSDDNKGKVKELIQQAKQSLEDEDKSKLDYFGKVFLQDGESFDFEIKKEGDSDISKGKDVAVIKVEAQEAPTLRLLDLDKGDTRIDMRDDITVIGYPLAADVRDTSKFFSEFFDEDEGKESARRSLGEATVSGGQISNPFKSLDSGVKVIQLDTKIAGGNSGSPVIDQYGKVVGIVAFVGVDSGMASNIPFAIPTLTVLEFVRDSGGVFNNPSTTDELYQRGLEALRNKDYVTAKSQFEAVVSAFPQHSEAGRLKQESDAAIADSQINKSFMPWLLGLGGGLALLVLASQLLKGRINFSTAGSDNDFNMPIDDGDAVSATQGATHSRSSRPAPTNMWANMTRVFRPHTEVGEQPCIILENPDREEIEFLLVKDEHHIGRDPDWSDLKIPEYGWEIISRHHATLKREGDDYVIYDGDSHTGSTNKTFINDMPVPVNTGVPLSDGDVLVIGKDPDRQVKMTYSIVSKRRHYSRNGHHEKVGKS